MSESLIRDPIARAQALLESATWKASTPAGWSADLRALADECVRMRAENAELRDHLQRLFTECEENTGHRFDSDGECLYCGMER